MKVGQVNDLFHGFMLKKVQVLKIVQDRRIIKVFIAAKLIPQKNGGGMQSGLFVRQVIHTTGFACFKEFFPEQFLILNYLIEFIKVSQVPVFSGS